MNKLHETLKNKNKIIRWLINNGVNNDSKDVKGNTPFYTAINQRNNELIENYFVLTRKLSFFGCAH